MSKFPHFSDDCRSLLSRFLTRDIFDALADKTTGSGFSFQQMINSGVANLDSGIGVYAGDEESYSVFAALFDPIIGEYHGFDKTDNHRSNLNADDLDATNLDPAHEYIISTRIRVGRNLAGLPLGPNISRQQRKHLETEVSILLQGLSGELAGQYYPLAQLTEEDRERLIADHFLFKAGDRFLDAAGCNRDWPEGRGIYHNRDKTFLVWINEEDHLRIISMQAGGDIKAVFTRLVSALNLLQTRLSFSQNQHLGYISSCPTNLGTAMRASVHISLPNLALNRKELERITEKHELQIRGIHGEHSDSEAGIFDISNRRRLGISEVECVQGLYEGVKALIEVERSLSASYLDSQSESWFTF